MNLNALKSISRGGLPYRRTIAGKMANLPLARRCKGFAGKSEKGGDS
jgi:hypothetical protein